MSKIIISLIIGLSIIGCTATIVMRSRPAPSQVNVAPWQLVWNDEFNGASGSRPDLKKWRYLLGNNGFGNQELQYYTNRPENAAMDGEGNLRISVVREEYDGSHYTSARLITAGKFERTYGRYESRIKIPSGQGLWPSFWLLGADIMQNHWPNCGEIDVLENVGKEPTTNHSSLHGPGYSYTHSITVKYHHTKPLSNDFHIYAVEWEPNVIRFYFDGRLYQTFTPENMPSGKRWVFDHDFYIILNVAVGGVFPGSPDNTTKFPADMLIDYVRVYQR